MSDKRITSYPEGRFCWVELITPDPDAAKQFYGKLFGWAAADHSMGDNMVYTMLQVQNSVDVAALYGLSEDQQKNQVPPHWGSYVAVDSVDRTAEKAKSLGGSVIVNPMDVSDSGRMAVLKDPGGANVAIWEAKEHIGAGLRDGHGTFGWNELLTHDIDACKSFYSELFEWKAETKDMGGIDYTSFKQGDQFRAGMMAIQKEWGDKVPPNWLVYFTVRDLDAAMGTAKEQGGSVDKPHTVEGLGRFAIFRDPQGATSALMEWATAK